MTTDFVSPNVLASGIAIKPRIVEQIEFHGVTIEALPPNGDGKVWISVRRVCEALGIDNKTQQEKLATKEWACVGLIPTQLPGDVQTRLVFCIDLDSLPMWLATIESSRVKPAVRPLLLRFQRECARILRDHFFGVRTAAKAPAPPVTGCTTQPATATTRSARRPDQWTPDIALATLFLEDAAHQVDPVQRQWSLIRAAEEASGEALQHRWPAVKEAAKQDLRLWCEGSRTLVARIAQRLPRLRAAQGLGVEDLARLSGRSAKRIREIEAGRGAPSMETALAFAHVLGCPVEELVATTSAQHAA